MATERTTDFSTKARFVYDIDFTQDVNEGRVSVVITGNAALTPTTLNNYVRALVAAMNSDTLITLTSVTRTETLSDVITITP